MFTSKIISATTNVILVTKEVITATLKVISATTKVILSTEVVITATLQNIQANTKVILITDEVITATKKVNLSHWRRDHSHFKSYLGQYKLILATEEVNIAALKII